MKVKDLKNNKLAQLFNLTKCKRAIKNCPKDEAVILLSHYSVTKPNYNDESEFYDFDELQDYFGCSLLVSDFDDLVCDPHGLYSE